MVSFVSDIPIYVAHYIKVPERKNYLSEKLLSMGFTNVEFSSHYCDRDNIYTPYTETLLDTSSEICDKKYEIIGINSGYHILSKTQPAYLGNFLNHIEIWKKVASGNSKYALILEDDAYITDDQILFAQLQNIPIDLDIGYLHAGCGFTLQNYYGIVITPENSCEWVKTPKRRSRTMCTYLLTKDVAQCILDVVFPITWAIDHEINYIQNLLNLNVYWTVNHGIIEGSTPDANKYKSVVR